MSDEVLYARVKPYNPKRGHKVQRIFVRSMGRVIEGGTGEQKPIEWVRIRPDQAQLLRTYRQDDQDPDSKPVFDIVTLEQRQVIDRAEDAARIAGVGTKAPARKAPKGRVTDVRQGEGVHDPGETALEIERRAQILEGNEQESVEDFHTAANPSLIAGAEAFVADPAVVGRMQALTGLSAKAVAPEAAAVDKEAPPAEAQTQPSRPRKRAVRAKPVKTTDLPPMEEGTDINEAIGNQPAIDVDADDDR